MASSPPEHHMDRLGHRLGDRSCNSALATEKRLEKINSKRKGRHFRLHAAPIGCIGQSCVGDKGP
jgi:hypothetical protein